MDQNTLMIHLGPLQTVVKSGQREADREINNREEILSSWRPEISTLFETSTRHELGQVVKVVKKYPVYKDALDRINNLIIERLTDNNSYLHLKKSLLEAEIGPELGTRVGGKKGVCRSHIMRDFITAQYSTRSS